MSEFKGTKGKWKVDKCEKDSSGRACYRIHTYIRPMDSQMKANAQLISKAPEMLEMLKHLLSLKHAKDLDGKTPYYLDEMPKAWEKAEQLIKEATTI